MRKRKRLWVVWWWTLRGQHAFEVGNREVSPVEFVCNFAERSAPILLSLDNSVDGAAQDDVPDDGESEKVGKKTRVGKGFCWKE